MQFVSTIKVNQLNYLVDVHFSIQLCVYLHERIMQRFSNGSSSIFITGLLNRIGHNCTSLAKCWQKKLHSVLLFKNRMNGANKSSYLNAVMRCLAKKLLISNYSWTE